jgi:hypothetical protein
VSPDQTSNRPGHEITEYLLWHALPNLFRLLWFALSRLYFTIGSLARWVFDLDDSRLRELGHKDYFKEKKSRDERVTRRVEIFGYGFGGLIIVVFLIWLFVPGWAMWLLLAGVMLILVMVGRAGFHPSALGIWHEG